MKKAFLWAITACLLLAAPVMAKEGLYIGAFRPTNTISGDAGTNIDSGAGWGLRAGVGLSRYVAIEGNYSSTKHDVKNVPGTTSTGLRGLAGDLKLHFPLTSLDSAQVMTLEPYLLLGYGHYEFDKPSTVKSNGGQWGVGIELYLFRELSINAGMTRTKATFKNTGAGADVSGDIKTIDFGISYHFI